MLADRKIKLGVAPTRREDLNFPVAMALAQKDPVIRKLRELGVDFVGLDDVCKDGLLVSLEDLEAAKRKFQAEGIDALFIPTVVFGAEGPVSLLAKALMLPTLLWGPRDPEGRGATGKAGLGIYTIGKSLRRLGVPFTFMGTCSVEDRLFSEGIAAFLAAANLVKTIRQTRILQVGPRPESFWSVIVDEGMLMEKLGIPVYPIALPELFDRFTEVSKTEVSHIQEIVAELKRRTMIKTNEQIIAKSAAMAITLESLVKETHSNAVAIQCWHALPKALGIWPCAAGALLTEKGIPVACEGDVYGAVSCVIAQAASRNHAWPIFMDFDGVHPENPNAFNVHHCAISPINSYQHMPALFRRANPPEEDWGGCIAGELKTSGDVSFLRFDGDRSQYSILLGKGKAVSGPAAASGNSYGWYEVQDWQRLEYLLATGPYIHHGVIIYDDILVPVYEACKYLDIHADFAFDSEKQWAESFLYRV